MSYYKQFNTETLKTYETNLSKPREFTGNCAGSWEAYEGRKGEDYRQLKEIQAELKRREENPGIYEREQAHREWSKKTFGW